MSDQSGEEEIESYLGGIAADWAESRGEETLNPDVILQFMKNGLLVSLAILLIVNVAVLVAIALQSGRTRTLMLVLLIGIDCLLFIIPIIEGNAIVMWILSGNYVDAGRSIDCAG